MGSPPLQNRLIVKLAFEIGDIQQHNFSKISVRDLRKVAGCGVRAVGANESNMYRRTEWKNTLSRSVNQ